jgi:hypothetical protein
VPTGGTTGQILSKVSGTDYDTQWVNNTGGTGASALADLTDVNVGNLITDQILKWNGSVWVNASTTGAVQGLEIDGGTASSQATELNINGGGA